ncbi:MAG: hypothetical protein ACR2MW_07535 [Chthoniobacterales bacterium]
MKQPSVKATSAKNLEEKFDRGGEVLDYFDTRGAKVIHPSKSGSYVVKSETEKPMVVREGANEWAQRNETPSSKKKGEFMDVKSGGEKSKGVAKEPDKRRK